MKGQKLQQKLLADSDQEESSEGGIPQRVLSFIDKRDLLTLIDSRGGLELVNTQDKLLEKIQLEYPERFGGDKRRTKQVSNFVNKYKRSTPEVRHKHRLHINKKADAEDLATAAAAPETIINPPPLIARKMSSKSPFRSPSSGSGTFRSPASQKKNATESKFLSLMCLLLSSFVLYLSFFVLYFSLTGCRLSLFYIARCQRTRIHVRQG